MGGSRGGLGRARPSQSGQGCPSVGLPWERSDRNKICLRALGVVLAAEHHRSQRTKSIRPSRDQGWVQLNGAVGANRLCLLRTII